jgi:hypothetical protein
MATPKPRPNGDQLIPDTDPVMPADFPMEISDFATSNVRISSKVPDTVADLLEDLREAHGREIAVKGGQTVPAGQPKYKVASFPTEELTAEFKKHALSYSKGVMAQDGYSVRLSHLTPTSVRVGVGTIVPKPRKAKKTETIVENAETQES